MQALGEVVTIVGLVIVAPYEAGRLERTEPQVLFDRVRRLSQEDRLSIAENLRRSLVSGVVHRTTIRYPACSTGS